jgi:scavenger receptor class B, member 1
LKPGTIIYKFWSTPPQPLYIDIYFFNWTNPHEFNDNSKKPIFSEIGPYRFQEFPAKANVTFHDNATVSYRKQSRYIFLPEQSKGQLSDIITSVNVVALSSANQARSWNIFKVSRD